MLSAVLRSDIAVSVSIKIMDAFVAMRKLLSTNTGIIVTILTKTISKQLNLDIEKFNQQYPTIEAKQFSLSHDRFLIIDNKETYHLGASLKDLGKKWFAFSKMEGQILLEKIKEPHSPQPPRNKPQKSGD